MRPTPYVASLRVYEPLSAFEAADRLRWDAVDLFESKTAEQRDALVRVATLQLPSQRPDGAHILDLDGMRYVSPWSTSVRTWASLNEFKSTVPSTVVPFFVSNSYEEALQDSIDFTASKVPHIISQTWIIPPRWFALFETHERLRGHDNDGAYVICRTEITKAIGRAKTTHNAVRSAFGEGPVEQEILDLIDWLEMFHPKSIVELDYGGLADYLELSLAEEGGLEADTSIEDIQSSIAGLAVGDGALAGRGYERLVTRWRKVAAFEFTS
ncbi:MAG: hypothetical protein ACR2H8_04145 [Candidatus Nanopelagicaceae bacterium]